MSSLAREILDNTGKQIADDFHLGRPFLCSRANQMFPHMQVNDCDEASDASARTSSFNVARQVR